MRVVFAGTPEVALPALDAVAASRHELVGVVTRPDAPSGRGRKLVASPVAQRAEELGVPVLKPEHPRDPDFQAALAALRPDACPVVAYGALLPQSALDLVPHGWINLHFSVLPSWRGAAPGPARAVGGRRGHRRDDLPHRQGARRRTGLRDDDRADPPRRHRRRPARAPRRGRRRACWCRRSTASRTARWRRASSRRTGCRSPPRSWSTTRASTGATPRSRSTARCAPAPPPPARGAPSRASGSRSDRSATSTTSALAPGRPRGHQERRRSSAPPPRPCCSARSRRSARSRWRAADWARGVRLESGVRLGD